MRGQHPTPPHTGRTLLVKIAELVPQHPARTAPKPAQQQAGGSGAGPSKQAAAQPSKKAGKKKK